MKYIYPTLLESINFSKYNGSWFNYIIRPNYKYRQKHQRIRDIKFYDYTYTYKLKLYLKNNQKTKIKLWLDDCISVYNYTNNYIKSIINTINNNNIDKIINFQYLRNTLYDYLKAICEINGLNKHTADYAVKHCVTMYKSALSNHNNDFTKFTIKDLLNDRRRKNLVVEPGSVSKNHNSIFYRQLGIIDSSSPLSLIKRESILQYDTIKNEYFILIPQYKSDFSCLNHHKKVGVDVGVRSFITTYSKSETLEIGSDCAKLVDKYNKKLDSIKSNHKKSYKKAFAKYSDKLKNNIKELHIRVSNMLLKHYSEIIIGKVSIKKLISNLTGNIQEITKRRLIGLSHYKFREFLKSRAFKFGCKITEVSEYLTSKTCHNCLTINDNLGRSKNFKCNNCNLKLDRDINAAINIYKNIKLSR